MSFKQRRVFVRRAITKRTDMHSKVPVRRDRKHSWPQHADSDSYLYRVLRRWEYLAAMNGGFVYEKTSETAKHANHYRTEDAPCVRVVQLVKKVMREKGFISEDMMGKSKWRHPVVGFYFAHHSACCQESDGCHVLTPSYDPETLQKRFSKESLESLWIRRGFAPDSQPIRHEFGPDSPKSEFGFASTPSEVNENAAASEKSPRDLVGRNPLNPLNPINPLNPSNPKQDGDDGRDGQRKRTMEEIGDWFFEKTGKVLLFDKNLNSKVAEYGTEVTLSVIGFLFDCTDWNKIKNPAAFITSKWDSVLPAVMETIHQREKEARLKAYFDRQTAIERERENAEWEERQRQQSLVLPLEAYFGG